MSAQLELPTASRREVRRLQLLAKAAKFDAEHPRVWQLFVRFTFEKIRQGFRHYSSDAVLHRVRWETSAGDRSGNAPKINDHVTAYYARKFHDRYPEHEGFFRTRELR